MKMKILLILIFFIIVLIYSYTHMNKNEINYTIMGDKEIFSNNIISKNFSDLIYDELNKRKDFGFYSEEFIKEDIRIVDLINDIENNININNIYIQNILKKTNILLLNVGNNEVNYKLLNINDEIDEKSLYNYLDEVEKDFDKLIKNIKKYNDNKVMVLGYYSVHNNINNKKYFKYINDKIKEICKINKLDFINIYDILNENSEYLSNNYITNKGNLALFNEIYSKINELHLHKNN